MAFTTGTAASLTAFFAAVRSFAVTNAGFTDGGTATINGNTVHTLSKGTPTIYWNFEETVSRTIGAYTVYLARCRMTYSAPSGTFNETTPTGQKRYTAFGTYGINSSFTGYYLFTDGTAVHCVLEVQTGVFQHLSFGNITKTGTWTGGEYLTAGGTIDKNSGDGVYSYRNTSAQYPFADDNGDGFAPGTGAGFNSSCFGFVRYVKTGSNQDDFAPLGRINQSSAVSTFDEQHGLASGCRVPSVTAQGSGVDSSLYAMLLNASPNAVNFRSAMFPAIVRLRDRVATTSPGFYFIAGYIPYVAIINNQNISDGEIVNTDWQVFSTIQKDGDDTVAPGSGYVGLAYRRV